MGMKVREQITRQIVQALQAGVIPWRQSWRASKNTGTPANVASHRHYRSVNVLLLQMHAQRFGHRSRWYGTYSQIRALGGTVRHRPKDVAKGEWGCRIISYLPDTDHRTGEQCRERTYSVYNVEQAEGVVLDVYRVVDAPGDDTISPDFALAEELMAATGAEIVYGGDKCFYRRPFPEGSFPHHLAGDYICLPHRSSFTNMAAFYESCWHELGGHWTEARLGWDWRKRGRAAGELRAEMTACFVASSLGLPVGESLEVHAAYVGSWLRAMRADPNLIFQIAAEASKAADLVLSFVRKAEGPT